MEMFIYHWLHIPTGKQGESWIQCHSRLVFLEQLAQWNRALPGQWQYWTE